MSFDENTGGEQGKKALPPFVQYAEWIRLCLFAVLLFMAGAFLPFAGVIVALAAPAPVALIALRQGFYRAALGVILCCALVYIPFGELGMLSFALGAGAIGAALAFAVKKTETASEAIFALVIASLGAKLIFMWAMHSLTGHNPFMFDEKALSAVLGETEGISAMLSQLPLLIPSFLMLAAGLDAFVNYFLVSKIEAKREGEKSKIKPIPPFADWRFPRSLLVALLVALIIPIFEAEIPPEQKRTFSSVEFNLKIVVNILFFIQGMSFVWWWVLQKKFSRAARFLTIGFALVPIFSMGLVALGIGDIWLGLRERIEKTRGARK